MCLAILHYLDKGNGDLSLSIFTVFTCMASSTVHSAGEDPHLLAYCFFMFFFKVIGQLYCKYHIILLVLCQA